LPIHFLQIKTKKITESQFPWLLGGIIPLLSLLGHWYNSILRLIIFLMFLSNHLLLKTILIKWNYLKIFLSLQIILIDGQKLIEVKKLVIFECNFPI
jgi:hypothetical protein